MKYHYTPIKMAKVQNTDNSNAGEDVEQQEFSCSADGKANGTAALEDSLAVSYQPKHTPTG